MSTHTNPCPKCVTGTVYHFGFTPTCKNCATIWMSSVDLAADMKKAEAAKTAKETESYVSGKLKDDLRSLVVLTKVNLLEDLHKDLQGAYDSVSRAKDTTTDVGSKHRYVGQLEMIQQVREWLGRQLDDLDGGGLDGEV